MQLLLLRQGYSATISLGKQVQQAIPVTATQSHPVFRNQSGLLNYWWTFDNVPGELNAQPTSEWMVSDIIRTDLAEALIAALSCNEVREYQVTGGVYDSGTNQWASDALHNASRSLTDLTAMVQSISDGLTMYIRTDGPAMPPDP